MVGQMGGSQNFSAIERQLYATALIASDPKGTKKRLEEIADARAQMEAQAKESAARLKEAEAASGKLDGERAAFDEHMAAERAAIEAAHQALEDREVKVAKAEATLKIDKATQRKEAKEEADRLAGVEAELRRREDAVDARERDVGKREEATKISEAGIVQREAALKAKQDRLQKAIS